MDANGKQLDIDEVIRCLLILRADAEATLAKARAFARKVEQRIRRLKVDTRSAQVGPHFASSAVASAIHRQWRYNR